MGGDWGTVECAPRSGDEPVGAGPIYRTTGCAPRSGDEPKLHRLAESADECAPRSGDEPTTELIVLLDVWVRPAQRG